MVKDITETRRTHYIWYLHFYFRMVYCVLYIANYIYCSKKETHNPFLFFKMKILQLTR